MNSTPVPDAPSLDPSDPVLRQLTSAVSLAREAAEEVAGPHEVGAHVGVSLEDAAAATHLFDADTPGYRGWCWAVTVASAGVACDVTVSEVVLLPGPDALVAPEWVPWQERVQAGDLGVGDLMPTAPDDPRLVPGYLASDDEAVEGTALELGLGRVRVMGRAARLDAAERWHSSEFGPRSDMARGAPGHCVTCGFYLPLAGSLSAAFGVCANEIAPADGHLVHAEYGCGAHSEAEVEQVSPVLVADLIYDDNAMLDIELVDRTPEPPLPPKPVPAESQVAPEPLDALAAPPAEPREAPVAVEIEVAAPEVVEPPTPAEPEPSDEGAEPPPSGVVAEVVEVAAPEVAVPAERGDEGAESAPAEVAAPEAGEPSAPADSELGVEVAEPATAAEAEVFEVAAPEVVEPPAPAEPEPGDEAAEPATGTEAEGIDVGPAEPAIAREAVESARPDVAPKPAAGSEPAERKPEGVAGEADAAGFVGPPVAPAAVEPKSVAGDEPSVSERESESEASEPAAVESKPAVAEPGVERWRGVVYPEPRAE